MGQTFLTQNGGGENILYLLVGTNIFTCMGSYFVKYGGGYDDVGEARIFRGQ